MCFGSAFIAANSSAQFKVRKVYLTQHPKDEVSIEISPANPEKVVASENSEEGEEDKVTYNRKYTLYKNSDFLGQKKTLTLTYDTDMKIKVYLENQEENTKVHYATFTVNGIDEIANSETTKKEGSSKPKVSLSFELSRSALVSLNKAEAKVDELYEVEEKIKPNKTLKVEKEEPKDTTTE